MGDFGVTFSRTADAAAATARRARKAAATMAAGVLALGLAGGASLAEAGAAAPLDCAFFEAQAASKGPTDFSVSMFRACTALMAYRDRLLIENVRYAFGEDAAADPQRVRERAAPLDTFHVLPETKRYGIAHEAGVFTVIREIPPRRTSAQRAKGPRVLGVRPAAPNGHDR